MTLVSFATHLHLSFISALLRVNRTTQAEFEPTPICLPDAEQPKAGETCFVAGWGLLSERGPLAQQLHEVDLPIADLDKCRTWYGTYYSTRDIYTDGRNICAGDKFGGKDICLGDSGGPLMCQRAANCDWYVAGIVSWSYKCGKTYGIYSVPGFYQDWIEERMATDFVEDCKSCDTMKITFEGEDHIFYRKDDSYNFKPVWQSSQWTMYWLVHSGVYTSWLIIDSLNELSNSIENVDLKLIGHNTKGDYFCPQDG